MGDYILEATDLTKDYILWKGFFGFLRPQRRRAVDGVSFGLSRGEIVGLRGPNAAGKSTLLKLLAGLLRPTSGRIVVNTFDITRRYDQAIQEVAISVTEARSFYWRLTCRQNLEFFAALWGYGGRGRERKVDGVAALMGMTEYLDEKFMTLSSGLMQRMALARAMLANGSVWLFDEPTRDLDREYRDRIIDELKRLKGEHRSVMLVSHLLEDLEACCDRVLVMEDGGVGS